MDRGVRGALRFPLDGSTSYGTAPGGEAWMERWARFHSREPGRALVAIYRPNRLLRGRLLTYNRRADATLRLFDEEADARAWLSREIHA